MRDLTGPGQPTLALIAMAGEKTAAFREQVVGRLAALGLSEVVLDHDLLGIFHSGTAARDGYALIAGTGAVAARIRGGRLDRVVGGKGWLLGDAGSGFWIGHAVARAVVASLDGQGQGTALTDLVLEKLGIEADTGTLTRDVQRRCGSWSRRCTLGRPSPWPSSHPWRSRPTMIVWLAPSSSTPRRLWRISFLPYGHPTWQAPSW